MSGAIRFTMGGTTVSVAAIGVPPMASMRDNPEQIGSYSVLGCDFIGETSRAHLPTLHPSDLAALGPGFGNVPPTTGSERRSEP